MTSPQDVATGKVEELRELATALENEWMSPPEVTGPDVFKEIKTLILKMKRNLDVVEKEVKRQLYDMI